jgi:hypothetical protein
MDVEVSKNVIVYTHRIVFLLCDFFMKINGSVIDLVLIDPQSVEREVSF